MSRINLSKKHGLNQSVSKCFVCGKDKGIVLLGRLKGDVKAPRSAVYDNEPCEDCKKIMLQGVMLIIVKDGESGANPFRTGAVVGLKDTAIERMFNPDASAQLLKSRIGYLEESIAKKLGIIST